LCFVTGRGVIVSNNSPGRLVNVMYRCYFIRDGRIVDGNDLDAETPAEAVAGGRRLLEARAWSGFISGMEIWCGEALVYSDRCHADDTGTQAAISSPFATPETTILPNWRPTLARPIGVMAGDAVPVTDTPQTDPEMMRLAALRKAVRRRAVRGTIAA
jgi:hypothetical protein